MPYIYFIFREFSLHLEVVLMRKKNKTHLKDQLDTISNRLKVVYTRVVAIGFLNSFKYYFYILKPRK